MPKQIESQTDWERVRRNIAENAPIPYDPEDGPYDPNDPVAVKKFWDNAIIIRPNPSKQKSLNTQVVSLNLSQEVLAYYMAQGPDWQTRIDEALKKSIAPRRRKRAS